MFSMTEVTVVPCEISISAGTQTGQCRPTYQQNISTANYQSLYEDSTGFVPHPSPQKIPTTASTRPLRLAEFSLSQTLAD